MRHPAASLFGVGLLSRLRLAQWHLLGALIVSVVLHGVLLSQLSQGTRSQTAPEAMPPVLITRLWLPAPPLTTAPPLVPIAATERAAAEKQHTDRTVRTPVSVADAPSAATMPVNTHTAQPVESPPVAPPGPHSNRALDLSPQVISQAVRRSASPSLAQAAREQLGTDAAPAATRLGQHIASGVVPDCLHHAPDGEAQSKQVAVGGLFALPFLAYAAMTGKCK